MHCTKILIKWCRHYRLKPGQVSFEGYTDELPDDIGGRCYYYNSQSGHRRSGIEMPNKIQKYCVLCRIALWHEFCHAELFIKKGYMGHTFRWYLMMLRKPHMFIGQLLLILFWNKL